MLMSMAARIYKHPSIGNSINLVMIKLVIMGDEKLGPEVSDNSGLILRDFCTWQRDTNQPRDRHPEHFDTAVLLTREVEGLQTLWGKGRAQCWSRGGVAQMWSQPKCGDWLPAGLSWTESLELDEGEGEEEEVTRTSMRYFKGSRGMHKGSCPGVCDQLSAEVMTR